MFAHCTVCVVAAAAFRLMDFGIIIFSPDDDGRRWVRFPGNKSYKNTGSVSPRDSRMRPSIEWTVFVFYSPIQLHVHR